MDVMEAVRIRKSVRKYRSEPVEEEKLMRVLEAARLAPSARNMQEWRFVVVRDAGTRARLREAAKNQRFVEEAPVVIAACAEQTDHVMACGQLSYPIDVAISLDHLSLAAVEEGLGTCWIGAFDEGAVKEILGIPPHVRVVELMTLGYPADPAPVEKDRLPIDRIVRFERWE